MKHADKINLSFRYTPSRLTDVSKTFARVRKQMAEKAVEEKRVQSVTVFPLKARVK